MWNGKDVLITIAICVYNGADVLPRCLDSIARQTADEKVFSVLIYNDGSTDGTAGVIDIYRERLKCSLACEKASTNTGLLRGRIECSFLAAGEYIVFLDADDILDDRYIEELAKVILINQLDICEAYVDNIDPHEKPNKRMVNESGQSYLINYLHERVFTPLWGKAIKTEIARAACLVVENNWDWEKYSKVSLNEDLIVTPWVYYFSKDVGACNEARYVVVGADEHITEGINTEEGRYKHSKSAFSIAIFFHKTLEKYTNDERLIKESEYKVSQAFLAYLRSKDKTTYTIKESFEILTAEQLSVVNVLIKFMNSKQRFLFLRWMLLRK